MTSYSDMEVNADLLWQTINVNSGIHQCEVEAALGFDYGKVRQLSNWLVRETGEDVILPQGMSKVPHANATTGDPCQCQEYALNYGDKVGEQWVGRRLRIMLGHARTSVRFGDQLKEQFPNDLVLKRLVRDANRMLEDIEQMLAELAPMDPLDVLSKLMKDDN